MTNDQPRTDQAPPQERRFHGLAVSPGIARGPAFVRGVVFEEPETYRVESTQRDAEIERFRAALDQTRVQLEGLQAKVAEAAGQDEASVFDAHLLILQDSSVLSEVESAASDSGVNIESSFYRTMTRYISRLRQIDDPYLSERAVDIQDVTRRVLRNLASSDDTPDYGARLPHLLVSHELTPSDTAAMDRELVRGFATEIGSITSHTAILARSLGIPAVVGLHKLCDALHTGDQLLIDGYGGLAILDPSPETLAEYSELEEKKNAFNLQLDELRDSDSRTTDGRDIILSANIEFDHETTMAKERGARGIGLYRTEFFYMHGTGWPTEDQQAKNYARVAKGVDPDGLIIRTLDIGGDKLPDNTHEIEANPFLGYRGIRVSLDRVDVFKTQLRAVLRAAASARIGVMFPMVSQLDELIRAKELLAECAAELESEGVEHSTDIEVGVMIEVPSAALAARHLAEHVDFLSIGTNDLIQYTMAVDRVNEHVANLYQPLNPAVVRLIEMTVEAGHDASCWVGICGEMASDILFTPLLVGLGVDELSVAAPSVPAVKHAVRSLSYEKCKAMAKGLSGAADTGKITAACVQMAKASYPSLIS